MTGHMRAMLVLSMALNGGQALSEGLVNLGRTSIARVYASSVNGGRAMSNQYYGVLNLFDDGEHVVDGINYTYWLSDAGQARHWIRVTFDELVEVHSFVIELTSKNRPTEFAVSLKRVQKGSLVSTTVPSKKLKGAVTTRRLPRPIQNVREVMVLFPGPSMISVSEIQILGKVPKGVVTDVLPRVDVDTTEIERLARQKVRDYIRTKYDRGRVAERENGGWVYTVTSPRGRELMRLHFERDGGFRKLVDLESDIAIER